MFQEREAQNEPPTCAADVSEDVPAKVGVRRVAPGRRRASRSLTNTCSFSRRETFSATCLRSRRDRPRNLQQTMCVGLMHSVLAAIYLYIIHVFDLTVFWFECRRGTQRSIHPAAVRICQRYVPLIKDRRPPTADHRPHVLGDDVFLCCVELLSKQKSSLFFFVCFLNV